jgi:hypothetical protein
MNLRTITNAVTSRAGRQVLKVQKHSPAIMFVAGVLGVGTTVVLACRATLRVHEALDEHQMMAEKINYAAEVDEKYKEENQQRDMALLYTKTAVKFAKLYGPSVVVGAVSIAALTGAHVVLNRRNMALTAAYAAVEKGFKEYRKRVIDEYGEEKDKEFRYGLEDKTIVEETEEGPITKNTKALLSKKASIYARFFDESSTSWQKQPEYNQLFIQCQQNYANNLLNARGHVFLNEVYDMLGLARSREGSVVGWVLNGKGDGYIDFGVFRGDTFMGQQFVNGNERSILLDFNVDGVIYDKI